VVPGRGAQGHPPTHSTAQGHRLNNDSGGAGGAKWEGSYWRIPGLRGCGVRTQGRGSEEVRERPRQGREGERDTKPTHPVNNGGADLSPLPR
jgi:hypothetical protein